MKDKNIIGFHIALILFVVIVFCISAFNTKYCTEKIEDKIDELKPKETKTIEDYQNLIEESKEKIDEIAQDKWLKVSDIREKLGLSYSENYYQIRKEEWRELLKKAEDAPAILWKEPSYDSATLVDVSIGITAKQIIKALQSIDPNEFIRPTTKEKPAYWQIEIGDKE